jgi:hypothetical protein
VLPIDREHEIPNQEMIVLLRMRIGAPLATQAIECPVCAKATSDVHGVHGMACMHGNETLGRHNDVCACIETMLRSAGFQGIEREAKGLKLVPHTQQRPADLYVPGYFGNDLAGALDVTVVCPIAPSTLGATLAARGGASAAMDAAEKAKHERYERIAPIAQVAVLAFQSLGGFSAAVRELVKRCAQSSRLTRNVPQSLAVRKLRQMLAVRVMRATARKVLARIDLSVGGAGSHYVTDIEGAYEDILVPDSEVVVTGEAGVDDATIARYVADLGL